MTDNPREKTPETSGPTSPTPTPPRKAVWQRRLAIAAIVISGVLVGGAAVLYATYGDKTFGRGAADLLLQLAFLLVTGTFVKWLIDRINKERDKDQELRSKRLDFLRRMREAHVRIANAQRLIYADPSSGTYKKQMRVLMLVTPELEDIERDIDATTDLFCEELADKGNIQDGINEIVAYLDDGYDQYADWSKSGGGDETFSHQAEKPWLAELLRSERGMPKRYGCALDRSKGKIRSYVYGGRIDKGEHSGVAMSGQNKTLVRRFVQELLNAKNVAATDELLADDFVVHLPGAASIKGREAFKERLQHWRTAFPDWRISIEELIADCDKVAGRWRCEATHLGPLGGIAPTGKRVSWTATNILRIGNGRIAEMTAEEDMLGLMRQLGEVQEPTSAV